MLRRHWSKIGSGCEVFPCPPNMGHLSVVGGEGEELALEWSAVIEASSRQID